jgi:hypothetical protein
MTQQMDVPSSPNLLITSHDDALANQMTSVVFSGIVGVSHKFPFRFQSGGAKLNSISPNILEFFLHS